MKLLSLIFVIFLLSMQLLFASDSIYVKSYGLVFGAKPDSRGYIGGGEGYYDIFTSGDYEVNSLEELLVALSKVKSGEVIFIPGETEIDLTSMILIHKLFLEIPEGVTLAGDRGHNGSNGALIISRELNTPVMIKAQGENVRITGLRIQGPNPHRYLDHYSRSFNKYFQDREYYYSFPLSRGVITEFSKITIDNCEFSGFAHVAIFLEKGNDHLINHNYIHHCQFHGLGYGVSIDKANAIIENNIFSHNRHSIAGTGRVGSGYIARNNIDYGNALGHSFDMHGGKDRKDDTDIAGAKIEIYNNTFKGTNPSIHIRGIPSEQANISFNWFLEHDFHNTAILKNPVFENVFIGNNAYSKHANIMPAPDLLIIPIQYKCSIYCDLDFQKKHLISILPTYVKDYFDLHFCNCKENHKTIY